MRKNMFLRFFTGFCTLVLSLISKEPTDPTYISCICVCMYVRVTSTGLSVFLSLSRPRPSPISLSGFLSNNYVIK